MRNKLKKSILLTACSMFALISTVKANAQIAMKGCKEIPVNMYISPTGSSDLSFQCSDNCGFKIEKTGNSSVSVGGFSSTSDIYSITFYVPGMHTVRATDASGALVRTEIYEISNIHNYGNSTEWKRVSCDKDGLREYTCQNCGYRKEEVVPAMGHNFGEWILSTPPTAVAKGKERRECEKCGKKEYKSVDKLESSVLLSRETLDLKVGQSVKIDASGFAKGDYVLKWKNSNSKIASSKKNGSTACTIKAKNPGKAKITVVMRSGCKATCVVNVK